MIFALWASDIRGKPRVILLRSDIPLGWSDIPLGWSGIALRAVIFARSEMSGRTKSVKNWQRNYGFSALFFCVCARLTKSEKVFCS